MEVSPQTLFNQDYAIDGIPRATTGVVRYSHIIGDGLESTFPRKILGYLGRSGGPRFLLVFAEMARCLLLGEEQGGFIREPFEFWDRVWPTSFTTAAVEAVAGVLDAVDDARRPVSDFRPNEYFKYVECPLRELHSELLKAEGQPSGEVIADWADDFPAYVRHSGLSLLSLSRDARLAQRRQGTYLGSQYPVRSYVPKKQEFLTEVCLVRHPHAAHIWEQDAVAAALGPGDHVSTWVSIKTPDGLASRVDD